MVNYMKTNYIKLNRLIPVLGIALVAAGVMAAATYLGLERKIHSGQAFAATLDRLYQDQQLCSTLRTLHDGDVSAATQRLDLLLCDDILTLNAQLASADDLTRTYVKNAFAHLAVIRPKNAQVSAGAAQGFHEDQMEAEQILALACASDTVANKGTTAAR
jgi:hypothetical protein